MASAAGETNGQTSEYHDGPRRVVAGHYTVDLTALLGEGGMALVYRGRDLRTRRDVALKTLRLEYRNDPETRARFRKEARTMAFLSHPNVASLYDLYDKDDDAPWAVLEYVPGSSLKDILERDGPLSLDTTAAILEQVTAALAHLHKQGLVHLDVKPQNILMTPDGIVKLIDFGLAQQAGEPQELIRGSAFGTAAYLSPEQGSGEAVDTTSDIYSLGCVVYELLTGQPPFDAPTKNEIIRAHITQPPVPPSQIRSDLPAWVDDVVLGALAKNPRDRYQTISSFSTIFLNRLDPMLENNRDFDRTAEISTAPIVDAIRTDKSNGTFVGPQYMHRIATGIYHTVNLLIHRARRFSRSLWRLAAALFVANLILALTIIYQDGYLPGTMLAAPQLKPGATAEITIDNLRVRAGPGTFSEQIGLVSTGDHVQITGDATVIEGELWWPVYLRQNGEPLNGYVWSDGITPLPISPIYQFQHTIDGIRAFPDKIGDKIQTSRDRIPFVGSKNS